MAGVTSLLNQETANRSLEMEYELKFQKEKKKQLGPRNATMINPSIWSIFHSVRSKKRKWNVHVSVLFRAVREY